MFGDILGSLNSFLGGVNMMGPGQIPSSMAPFAQGAMNQMPQMGGINQAQLAMQNTGMPDLMKPPGAIVSPMTAMQPPGLGNQLMPGEWSSFPGGPMPDVTRGAGIGGMDQNAAMLGLAAMQRKPQQQQQAPRAPAAGLAQGQFRPYTPTPGARFMGRR